jgi:hypothetical protein
VSLDVGATAVVLGSTTNATDDYTTFCADTTTTADAPDLVYAVTLNGGGYLQVDLDDHLGAAEFDAALSLRKQCDARVGGDDCSNTATTNESLGTDLAAGTYWVVVDGVSGQSGDFSLTMSLAPPVCGDGIVNDLSAGEECDLMPAQPTLCSPPSGPNECQFGPLVDTSVEDCPGFDVFVAPGDDLDVTGEAHNLCALADDHVGTCAGANLGARDAVYHIHPSAAGTLTVMVGRDAAGESACVACGDTCNPDCGPCFVPVLYARKGACSGTSALEAACSYDPSFATTVAAIEVAVAANEDVWVFVDSNYDGPYTAGPYILEVTLTP